MHHEASLGPSLREVFVGQEGLTPFGLCTSFREVAVYVPHDCHGLAPFGLGPEGLEDKLPNLFLILPVVG